MSKTLPRKCTFCDSSKLSRTHIWPDWLEKLLSPGRHRSEELETPTYTAPTHSAVVRERKLKQGSLFSQKPYLACETCNTGWMKQFEDEMVKFAKPIFTSSTNLTINHYQIRVMAVWVSLITVLAEYIGHSQGSIGISEGERKHLKKILKPPDNWSIFVASLDGEIWSARYRHHAYRITEFADLTEPFSKFGQHIPVNTQISSFGMGRIFVQVFSSPNQRLVTDFRIWAKATGLSQLWPSPSGLWPLRSLRGSVEFPTRRVLNDDEAEVLANEFNEIINVMTRPTQFGGREGTG
jgi:hypothetical protein